jgi:hypothetical protein
MKMWKIFHSVIGRGCCASVIFGDDAAEILMRASAVRPMASVCNAGSEKFYGAKARKVSRRERATVLEDLPSKETAKRKTVREH